MSEQGPYYYLPGISNANLPRGEGFDMHGPEGLIRWAYSEDYARAFCDGANRGLAAGKAAGEAERDALRVQVAQLQAQVDNLRQVGDNKA